MRILYHSYLGYQCYADTDPESHWKLNYGGGVMVHFDRLAFWCSPDRGE